MKFTKTSIWCSKILFSCRQIFTVARILSFWVSCKLSNGSFLWLIIIFVVFIIAFSYLVWTNYNPLFAIPFRPSYIRMIIFCFRNIIISCVIIFIMLIISCFIIFIIFLSFLVSSFSSFQFKGHVGLFGAVSGYFRVGVGSRTVLESTYIYYQLFFPE